MARQSSIHGLTYPLLALFILLISVFQSNLIMPRPQPHPLALFSLRPVNERARAVVTDPNHDHFVSTLPDGTLALDIGHIRSKSCGTLATLGRDADIYVPGSSIAKLQCSFEVDLDTNVVMLYDRSHAQTTQVYGENATPFEPGRLRKVVVQQELNTMIGMGGVGRNIVLFELEWHHNAAQTMENIKDRESISVGCYEENPRLARTIADEADTVVPSRETRPHTAGSRLLKLRYGKVNKLGSGQFGEVWKAVDADSGKLMAVKILQRPPGLSKQDEWRLSLSYALKREVEILSKLSHVSETFF
jgi:hypothetical protein